MPEQGPSPLITLSVALLFAGIFLFGGRAAYRPGQKGRRRFLSFAAGIAVGYAFVHVLPALNAIRELHMQSPANFYGVLPEYSVYLWTMAGFMAFYGLEFMAGRSLQTSGAATSHDQSAVPWQPWIYIGGFALYTWLLAYLMVWTGKGKGALAVYAVAMGMHLFPIACNLRTHYQAVYDRGGAYLLAAASLVGWACGLALNLPRPVVFNLVALVAGGVIVNAAIAELPKEKEGKYWFFTSGAAIYAALLLTLSHFEKGG